MDEEVSTWRKILSSGHTFKGITGILSFIVFLGNAGAYSFYKFMPMEFWMDYIAYEVKPEQCIGSDFIKVDSYARHGRPVDVHFSDPLICGLEMGDEYDNFTSQHYPLIPNYFPPDKKEPVDNTKYGEDVYLSPWKYTEDIPRYETTCAIIDGAQTIHLPFNIKRTSYMTSNQFQFVHCDPSKEELERK